MIEFINRYIMRIKGEPFSLDTRIPPSYMSGIIISRAFMILRGFFSFCRNDGHFFRDRHTVIKCKSKIRLGKNVTLGRNCFIDALSENGIRIGNNVSIGKFTTIECSGSLQKIGVGLKVGDGTGLGTHGFFGCAGGVEIGANTIFGNFVSVHSENHNFSDPLVPIKMQGINRIGIKIGDNCWIGAKVTILDGVTIGNGCIIAAGAVLTRGSYDINGIYGGNPARFLKKRI